jgi:hypothetical protein
MVCDHEATKSSLRVFLASTDRVAFQDDGEGGTLLLGNCRGCRSTLAVEIDLTRGRIVRGELGEVPQLPYAPADDGGAIT